MYSASQRSFRACRIGLLVGKHVVWRRSASHVVEKEGCYLGGTVISWKSRYMIGQFRFEQSRDTKLIIGCRLIAIDFGQLTCQPQ